MEKIVFCIISLLFVIVSAQEFLNQYIGDTLTVEKANARDFCVNKYCLLDSQLLFYAATQNTSVDPCVDFKEFAIGTFIKYRALNDRHRDRSFLRDVLDLHKEKQRKVLAAKIDEENDPRMLKVLKNFFRKCVDSRYVRTKGRAEIIEYLKSLGGSPLLSGDSWDPTKFNVSKIIQQEPRFATFLLLQGRIRIESSNLLDMFPLSSTTPYLKWLYSKYTIVDPVDEIDSDFKELIKELFDYPKLNNSRKIALDEIIIKTNNHVRTFVKEINAYDEKNPAIKEVVKVKDLKSFAPNLKVDWLKFLNDQLLDSSKITEEHEIEIKDPDLTRSYIVALSTIDKGVIADYFALYFLNFHRFVFIVYPLDNLDKQYRRFKKAIERWTQCIDFVSDWINDSLEYFTSKSVSRVTENLERFTEDAVQDYIKHIRTLNKTVLRSDVKEPVLENLSKITPVYSKTKRYFTDISDIENFNKELNLKGDENLLQPALEIEKFSQISKSQRIQFVDLSIDNNYETHILKIPTAFIFYPWYHDERPRFFNQATLYVEILEALTEGVDSFLRQELKYCGLNRFKDKTNEYSIAYESYIEWEQNGGRELLLGANRMTPRQLFWFALARSRYIKERAAVEQTNYQSTIHLVKSRKDFKSLNIFREAFNCKNETQ